MSQIIRVVGFLIILLVLAMITGFQPLYWLIYVAVAGAVIGYIWAWIQSRGLEVHVQELSPHPQVGQTVQVRVEVKEKAGLPRVGLRARLVGDFASTNEEDFSLAPHGDTSWTLSGLCRRRGWNSVGSVAMVSGDPTGLLRLNCMVGKPQSILAYPTTIQLSRAVIQGQITAGEIGEAGHLIGHSPTVSIVRDYIPGDMLTHIHWPTTARRDQLMTKEFEGAGINEILLFVDLQEAAQTGSGDDSTEEYSITIAASLASSLIQEGHSVGLVTLGDQLYRFLPRKDPNHLWSMLGTLAVVRASGKTPMQMLMTQETGNLGPGTVAIVVGPWPGKSIGSLFQFLTRRGILVVPIFLDTGSFGRAGESRWLRESRLDIEQWAFVVSAGDDLSKVLGNVLDRIASY